MLGKRIASPADVEDGWHVMTDAEFEAGADEVLRLAVAEIAAERARLN